MQSNNIVGKQRQDNRKSPAADGADRKEITIKALAELKAKGVKMAFEMRDNPGTAFAFISDNAGNAIELIEHKAPR